MNYLTEKRKHCYMAISNFVITGDKGWETYKLCHEWEIIILSLSLKSHGTESG